MEEKKSEIVRLEERISVFQPKLAEEISMERTAENNAMFSRALKPRFRLFSLC